MRILTTIEDGSLYIWEYRDSLYLKTLVGHERTVESINLGIIYLASEVRISYYKL